jgi:hypothetical protein
MREHLISGAIAAAVAGSIAGGVAHYAPVKVEHVTHVHLGPAKHAWPDLNESDKAALAEALKTLPKDMKFTIVCNDAGCTDLAMDIDDAMEAAGLDSALDRSIGALGYGIGIQSSPFDHETAEKAAAALKASIGFDLPVVDAAPHALGQNVIAVMIGKYRTPAK